PPPMDSDLRAAIAKYVRHAGYQPAKPVVIAQRLGLTSDEQVKSVRLVIKKMVKAGELEYGPRHMVFPPGGLKVDAPEAAASEAKKSRRREEEFIVGTFRRVSGGDGFVRPAGTPASTGRDNDIHVSVAAAGDAASGDKVRIRLDKHAGYKGKPEGRVVDVVERATSRF